MPITVITADEIESKIAAAKLDQTLTVDESIERLVAQGIPRRAAAIYAAHHHGTFEGDLHDPAAGDDPIEEG